MMTSFNHAFSLAQDVYQSFDILRNPYFDQLKHGDMSLTQFQHSQQQFFHAVTFFPGLWLHISRLPDPQRRLDILHNLVEEHGNFQTQAFHHQTFLTFLQRIGCPMTATDDNVLIAPDTVASPCVHAFNSVLTSSCTLEPLPIGIACMGIIEYAFADISATIGQAIIDRGWLDPDQLIHYGLHAEIDQRHASEFFDVFGDDWTAYRSDITQGLNLGLYIFDRLYRDLTKQI